MSEENPRARKTHCPKGHPYDEENTYVDSGVWKCKTCRRDRYEKRRDQGLLKNSPRHGTVTGYREYGCKCDLCKAAYRRYYREHRGPLKTGGWVSEKTFTCKTCGWTFLERDSSNNLQTKRDHQAKCIGET